MNSTLLLYSPIILLIINLFILLPCALMFGEKIANVKKKNKKGEMEKIGYKDAIFDVFVAIILSGFLSGVHIIFGIISFFGIIYVFI